MTKRWLVVGWILAGAVATAQPDSEADRLFREGRTLMDEGRFTEACARFEQSIAKDPRAIGTLMNLALCNARAGKIATAVQLFQEAHDRAAESGATRARDSALAEITRLKPDVPIVVLARAGAPLPGERIVIDERVTAAHELSLDPGDHTLVVTAPGRLPFETKVTLKLRDRTTVTIPVLAMPHDTTIVREASTRRTTGKLTTIAGAGVAAISLGVGLYVRRDYDQLFDAPDGGGPAPCNAEQTINGKPSCSPAGQKRAQRDRNIATAATVIGVAGLVAAGVGIVLWSTAPRHRETKTITLVPTGDGFAVRGRF